MAGGRGDDTTVPRALGRLRVAMDHAYVQTSRELGLTAQQTELLCAAMRPDGVSDLAHVLGRDHSTVSRLVDRAAKRGLLRRRGQDSDGRVSVIELTPEGLRLAQRFIKTLEAKTAALVASWSAKQRQTAIETMTQLSEALEGSTGRPGENALPRGPMP